VSHTQQLHQLQKMDSQILTIRRRLAEIAGLLVESEALQAAKQATQDAETTYHRAKATMTDLELEVQSLQQKITENEKRLYSGRIASPKEAGNLQDEVAANKRWLVKREEDLLEALISYEESEVAWQTEQERLTQTQTAWQADQSDLLQEREALQLAGKKLLKDRQNLVQFVADGDLAIYERLRKQLGGVGLAEVEDGTCLTCGVMVSSRMVQQAATDNRLYYCDNCRRIIHVL